MLETRKDITFTGTSYVEKTVTGSSEKQRINIVYLSASISDDGSSVSVKAGMSDNWIQKNIGMDKDELLRLKQISGLAELFADKEFSLAKD